MRKKHLDIDTNSKMLGRSKHNKWIYIVVMSSTLVLLAGCQNERKTSAAKSIIDGLYNVETESEFSSYMIDEMKEYNTELDITAEVDEIEKQYEDMNQRLKEDDLNQSDMNFLAKDIYVLWDDEINKIWGYLKDTLDKDSMEQLTIEQKEWITMKENEVKEAGSVYEGGSIRPTIEFLKGAELTRDRVYELMELLK